jgi:hypothetical protein
LLIGVRNSRDKDFTWMPTGLIDQDELDSTLPRMTVEAVEDESKPDLLTKFEPN